MYSISKALPCLNEWKAGLLCEGGGQGCFSWTRSDNQIEVRNQKEHAYEYAALSRRLQEFTSCEGCM
jgi:hypothetical protein